MAKPPAVLIFNQRLSEVGALETLGDDALEAELHSRRLLLNLLPQPIAARLKNQENPIADGHAEVSILFADIVEFTKLSSRMLPRDLVTLLNEIFLSFDRLADKYAVEKIKTVGDAYMAVSGLPQYSEDHAERIADLALEMLGDVKRFSETTGVPLSIRIGINSGSVVAGVIGRKRFLYDVWGDAVNTAARMESFGVVGGIQVTEQTYYRLRGKYAFDRRGLVDIKGKGPMETYLLLGRAPDP